jgi:cobalt/nickel transport system permease protein
VGAGHGHRLLYPGRSPLHRLGGHVKIVGLLGFMLVVVATPRAWFVLYLPYSLALAATVAVSRVPLSYLAKRMVVEAPFLAFAALLPFLADGPSMNLAGMAVSKPGLLAACDLAMTSTLGTMAGLLLAATTEPAELLRGMRRLRVPAELVQIMSFMIRYADLVLDEMRRMRIALESRGFDPCSPRHWRVISRSAGALFIRSYERGERVHVAMLSRGYRR